MKKLFLSFLIALGLLLPAVNNTANAAGHASIRVINGQITGWVFFATSQETDGQITLIEVYSMSTGRTVISQKCTGYSASVDLHGLPSGGYSIRTYCQYNTLTQQYKL
jgi:hypothetical protein